MLVNSAFKTFYSNRSALGSGMTIALLAIFFIASSFTKRSDRDLRAKQVNLVVRQIGHRLLLQAGDSTSRVLPVTEITEGTFLLTFENEFAFNHYAFLTLAQELLPKTQFPSGYTVTVHDCLSAGIVYGFQINKTAPDNLACRGRSQPSGCYTIEIAFPDLYEKVEQQKADTGHRIEALKPFKVALPEANPIPKAIGTEELKSFKVDYQAANRIPIAIGTEEFKPAFNYPIIHLVYGSGMLMFLGITLLIGRFGKTLTPAPAQHQTQAIIRESAPDLATLGKFLFDVRGQRLVLGSEVISLTDKECRILELLNENFGELIPRDTLMQKVWINEGVITGRSLDMFVSKLRKKLSPDSELRITNVHGKGYKLEIPEIL